MSITLTFKGWFPYGTSKPAKRRAPPGVDCSHHSWPKHYPWRELKRRGASLGPLNAYQKWSAYPEPAHACIFIDLRIRIQILCVLYSSWTCATMCNKPLWNCSHVLFNPWFLGKRQMAACRYHQPGPCKPTTYHSPMHLWSQRFLQMILSHSYHRGQKDKLFSEVLVKNPLNTTSDNLGSISIWFQSFPGGIFPKAKLVTGLVVICFSATGPQWPSWYPKL